VQALKTYSIISTIELNQFINIKLLDETSHYFGGYHHVRILAYSDVPVLESFFDNSSEFKDARSRLGESVRFERTLQKMAVPENEIVTVRSQLVDAFNETTLAYLSVPDFAERFVRTAYRKCIQKSDDERFQGV
jgi:hypothetical protein